MVRDGRRADGRPPALVVFKAPGPSFLDRFAEEAVTLEKPLPPASASVPMHPLYGALGTPRRQGSPRGW